MSVDWNRATEVVSIIFSKDVERKGASPISSIPQRQRLGNTLTATLGLDKDL